VHKQDYKITRISFSIAFSIVLAMVIVFLYDYNFNLKLYEFGILPRNISGLIGVLASPFIHNTDNYSHLLNNSIPMFVLTWLLFYSYRTVAGKVFVFIYLFTGLVVWLLGRETYHVGMSGIIYGLTAFLITSGFYRKNMRVAGISLLVIFLYGSIIWGVIPLDPAISWEGHFFGFLSGMIMAGVYRNSGPQPVKYIYEVEEELGFEYEEEFWLEKPTVDISDIQDEVIDVEPDLSHQYEPFKINYIYVPTIVDTENVSDNYEIEEEE